MNSLDYQIKIDDYEYLNETLLLAVISSKLHMNNNRIGAQLCRNVLEFRRSFMPQHKAYIR